MRIGVDYYPEHWDRSLWESDADLMQQTGVEVVRLAEFAWCRLEPQEGCFDFGWLDDIIEMLTERGIKIVLCTPTNCPPLWFYEKYPESLPGGCNPKDFPNDYFDAYAQVKKYFDNGGKQVEVFVPNDHLYFICCPDAKSSVLAPSSGSGTIENCEWMITWKYPGLPATSDLISV